MICLWGPRIRHAGKGSIMSNLCAACGTQKNSCICMGGTFVCRECEPEISAEIEKLRSEGRTVNVAHIAHRIYRATHSGGDYFLRNIPTDLWLRAKHRAIDDGYSLRDLILMALYAYLLTPHNDADTPTGQD